MTDALYTLDDSLWFEWVELSETDSTNNFLKNYHPIEPKEMTLVTATYQSAGRGQQGNSWESEKGKNLLFSLRIHPRMIEANRQFVLSQAISLAICSTLSLYTEDISIKWPNDIYWKDKKIGGILIENTLTGKQIDTCIIGAGINVNQETFTSDAPNPVSLIQIIKKETELTFILAEIVKRFKEYLAQINNHNTDEIVRFYADALYRRNGYHPYSDANGSFEAKITTTQPSGHLVLTDREGRERTYAFKEVRFIIPNGTNKTIEL